MNKPKRITFKMIEKSLFEEEIVGAPKVVKILFGVAIAQRANVEVGNAHALLLAVNVTLMYVKIIGLIVEMALWEVYQEVIRNLTKFTRS